MSPGLRYSYSIRSNRAAQCGTSGRVKQIGLSRGRLCICGEATIGRLFGAYCLGFGGWTRADCCGEKGVEGYVRLDHEGLLGTKVCVDGERLTRLSYNQLLVLG